MEDQRPKFAFYDALVREAASSGIELTTQQLQAMKISNSPESLHAYGWMDWYFNLVGDKMPNKDQIQLETQFMSDVHEEYVEHQKLSKSPQVSNNIMCYESFYRLWKAIFPHVRIREYKNVCGK